MKVVAKYSGDNETSTTICCVRCNGFFLEFNKRISENYPELFSEGTNGNAGGFAKKWGSYSEAVTLATDEVQRIIGVPLGTPVNIRYTLVTCIYTSRRKQS